MIRSLDLDAVRAFVLVADLASFTRAAEAMNTAQAAVSLKIKRLEARLGYRLLERTPRHVQLSERGQSFIVHARELLAAHERAITDATDAPGQRLSIGISDHVAGPELPAILIRLSTYDPTRAIEVQIAASNLLVQGFDQGAFDAIIVRSEGERRGGVLLFEDCVGWFASPAFRHRAGEPLRLANLAAPCGMRAIATKALDAAKMPWNEVFVGGGIMAVGAAVTAGLAVAAVAARLAPPGAIDVGAALKLPALPRSRVLARTRVKDQKSRNIFRTLIATFRSPMTG